MLTSNLLWYNVDNRFFSIIHTFNMNISLYKSETHVFQIDRNCSDVIMLPFYKFCKIYFSIIYIWRVLILLTPYCVRSMIYLPIAQNPKMF